MQQLCVFAEDSGFDRTALDRFRDQQHLTFDSALQHAYTQMFVQNPFMQRVLIDDFDSVLGCCDQVTVVNLQRPELIHRRRICSAACYHRRCLILCIRRDV